MIIKSLTYQTWIASMILMLCLFSVIAKSATNDGMATDAKSVTDKGNAVFGKDLEKSEQLVVGASKAAKDKNKAHHD